MVADVLLQGAGAGQTGRRRVQVLHPDGQELRVRDADPRRSCRRTAAQQRR